MGIAVSYANASPYSMAAHSTFAAGASAGDDVLAALRTGADLPDERLQALAAFTRALLRESGHAGDDELAAFEGAGYTARQALDVIAQVAYTTLANLVANLADTPVDDAFAAQEWRRVVA